MNYLVFTDIGFGQPGSDPESLAARRVWNVTARAEIDISLPHSVEHRKGAALALNVDDRAFSSLPHHVRRSLASHQQTITADALESHSHRHPLVGVRVVGGQGRVLRQSRFTCAQQ